MPKDYYDKTWDAPIPPSTPAKPKAKLLSFTVDAEVPDHVTINGEDFVRAALSPSGEK